MTEYVELHARSAFSFLEGASVPEELAGACAEFGMPAMALLDRNGVYGAPRFHMAAEEGRHPRAHRRRRSPAPTGISYPLLVETREGYQNLCRLITRMKLRAKKGEGAATLGRAGGILARADLPHAAIPTSACSRSSAAGNVYAELQRHLPSRGGGAQPGDRRARAAAAAFRWWPPTAWPTPRPRSASCSTCSPACATK